jgi:hypothetical protein
MSDAHTPPLPATTEPLRVAIRRLRWFRQAFARQLDQVQAETGLSFTVDDRKLAHVFVEWLRRIEAQKPTDPAARRAYFDFVSALMLRDLLREVPLTVAPLPAHADTALPEYFWPEGFACTLFCLNMRAAVLEQEFNAETALAPMFFDLRSWWSFRENVGSDANAAMGFFDVFTGQNPDWQMPDSFRRRLDRALAGAGAAVALD